MSKLVYFIQSEQTLNIKIGKSTDPQARMADLRTANSGTLRLLGSTDRYLEDHLHERFAEDRLHGEWFRPSPNLMDFIKLLGFVPLYGTKRAKNSFAEDHPFWASSKLHGGGDWYDETTISEFEGAVHRCIECECEEACFDNPDDPDDPNDDIDDCPALAAIDLMCLFQVGEISGALVDEKNKSLAIVFRRDQSAKEVEWIRGEIRKLTLGFDCCMAMVPISWDDMGNFQKEEAGYKG
jgi:hypothetical protein